MTERNPDSPESFEDRWRALADELAQDLPGDLEQPGHVVHHALPPELINANLDDAGTEADFDHALGGPRDWEAPAESDRFEPPEAPPVMAGDPLLNLAWVALVGGLLALIAWAVAPGSLDVWVGRFGLLVALAGLGVLVWRMPHHRDPEDTDNGAQV